MNNTPRFVFLYTEIAGYTLACLRALVAAGSEVHIVRWPVNQEAPFAFDFTGIQVYNRRDYDTAGLLELIRTIDPQLIVCSGWMDKGYVAVAKQWRKRIPVVLAMDNKWTGSIKQHLARLAAPFTLRRTFNRVWVPGALQRAFALRLGFAEKQIETGFYSADVPLFAAYGDACHEAKQLHFPHRFVYIGRYYAFKGLPELCRAFIRLRETTSCDWELWCAGTGDLEPVLHAAIKHLGFQQPEQMGQLLAETGVFVMPSHIEPWGVVLHEFTAAGFPVVCSSAVGAASQFVQQGVNGYLYPAENENALLAQLLHITQHSDEELRRMGAAGRERAQTVTPQGWAKTVFRFLATFNS